VEIGIREKTRRLQECFRPVIPAEGRDYHLPATSTLPS
jgi:hypothetical protein